DGAGPLAGRVQEMVYDASGKVVASRFNSDPWTCTVYDAQERITSTAIPAINGRPGRTITNNYAVGGNPLVTRTTDGSGSVTIATDLLGRALSYTDAAGNVTTSSYDTQGHLVSRTGPLGLETFGYDAFDRLTTQSLDNTVLASITYDAFSR